MMMWLWKKMKKITGKNGSERFSKPQIKKEHDRKTDNYQKDTKKKKEADQDKTSATFSKWAAREVLIAYS